jgi:hypothetical protein
MTFVTMASALLFQLYKIRMMNSDTDGTTPIGHNNRPLQHLNNRTIKISYDPGTMHTSDDPGTTTISYDPGTTNCLHSGKAANTSFMFFGLTQTDRNLNPRYTALKTSKH